MKKFLTLLLLLASIFAFAACGAGTDTEDESGKEDHGSEGAKPDLEPDSDHTDEAPDLPEAPNLPDNSGGGSDKEPDTDDTPPETGGSNDKDNDSEIPKEYYKAKPGKYVDDEEVGNKLGLKADFWEISWQAADGATEYRIDVNGTEHITQGTSFEIFRDIGPSEAARIRVTPIGPDGELENLFSGIYYTAESVTKGLIFDKDYSGNITVCCPPEAMPENGELVLPDEYAGSPIYEFRNPDNELSTTIIPGSSKSYECKRIYPESKAVKKIRLPAELRLVGNGALHKAQISRIYIPSTVGSIGNGAFLECDELCEISGGEGLLTIQQYSFYGCEKLVQIDFAEGVKNIYESAFVGTPITEVRLTGVQMIYAFAFYNCTELRSLALSDELRYIGNDVFYNTGWYDSLPDGLIYIEDFLYAYKGRMPKNTSLVLKDGLKGMPSYDAFKNQTNLVSITIPEGITAINESSFEGCTGLVEVKLAGSIERIHNNAFSGCENLRSINLPEGLKYIDSGAFYNCGFESITLPETLLKISHRGVIIVSGRITEDPDSKGVFEGCVKLKEIVIPARVRIIGSRAFYGCTGIEKVVIKDGVIKIGDEAFVGCTSLNELKIPDSVTSFALHSIAYTGIKHFVFPKNIERNSSYVPKHKDGLKLEYVVIQSGTKEIDYNWFYLYPGLKTIYFEGTMAEFSNIKLYTKPTTDSAKNASEYEKLSNEMGLWAANKTVYYYSEKQPGGIFRYWHYVDGVPTKW